MVLWVILGHSSMAMVERYADLGTPALPGETRTTVPHSSQPVEA